jgi:hypothetical protein
MFFGTIGQFFQNGPPLNFSVLGDFGCPGESRGCGKARHFSTVDIESF